MIIAHAEPLLQQALTIRQKVLGDKHHLTADTLQNLALVSMDQGKYDQAVSLCQQALAFQQEVLGRDHPLTQTTMKNYAIMQQKMRKRRGLFRWR